jgi:hypothetical protein
MACERGRTLHTQFERAVAARIRAKERLALQLEMKIAQKQEDLALLSRSMHISGCEECWVRPPK